MKTKQLFWGIFFITLGALILINNFAHFYFDWEMVWDLWPVVIIIFGLYFVLKDTSIKWVLIILNALILGFVIFAAFKSFDMYIHDDKFDEDYNVEQYNTPYNNNIKRAKLSVETAAGKLILKDTTSVDLVSVHAEGKFGNYTFNHSDNGEDADVSLELQHGEFRFGRGFLKNHVDMQLNSNPVWDIDLNVGAAQVDLNLEPYNTENLFLKSGAASVKVKLGNRAEKANAKFETGASSVEVWVPKECGCEINTDLALSSKNFEGFKKVGDGTYHSSNFESSSKKIYLVFQAGVSSLKVDQY